MAKLRSLSSNILNSLPPALLHKLGTLFTKRSENFCLEPQPLLETCELNERKMPRLKEVRDLYNQYKQDFLEEMDKLNATIPSDADVLLLAHYLHLGCKNTDYVDKVEAQLPNHHRLGSSDAEFLVSVMMLSEGEKILSRASQMLAATRICGYEYFVMDEQALAFRATPAHQPGNEFDRAFEAEIEEKMQERYGTGICRVHSSLKGTLWVVEITHGGAKQKESNENNAKTVDVLRQPIEVDCLIYDPEYNDIRIHMESKTSAILTLYCQSFGECLFQNKLFWHNKPKYTLDNFNKRRNELQALLTRGSKMLSNPTVGKLTIDITSVSYSQMKRLYGGSVSTDKYTRRNSKGLNNTMEEMETLVPIEATITSISLKFVYGTAKKKSLTICLTGRRRTLESEAIKGIEDWLHSEHFSHKRRLRTIKEMYEDGNEPLLEAAETVSNNEK